MLARKHLVIFASVAVGIFVLLAAIVMIVDPFFVYHKPLGGGYYVIDNQLSQNPGMARHFDYSSVMVGSSMTINFDGELFRDEAGGELLKLSYNGAYPKDLGTILQIVSEEKPELQRVYLCLDFNYFTNEEDVSAYELPAYLYDKNPLNDLEYLLNKEVLINYVLKPLVKKESTPMNEIYWNWKECYYNRDFVLSRFDAPEGDPEEMLGDDAFSSVVSERLQRYICPYIESMPNTEFIIFFPPYSVLFWYEEYGAGRLAADLETERVMLRLLSQYSNVRIYYFQNDPEYITNLNNYCDEKHHEKSKNDEMSFIMTGQDEEGERLYKVDASKPEEAVNAMHRWLSGVSLSSFAQP